MIAIFLMPSLYADESVNVPDITEIATWEPGRKNAQHVWATDEAPLLSGSVIVRSSLFAHPTLTVDYLIPVDAAKRPIPSAGDMFAFFPTPGGRGITSGIARSMAARWGFSVFSVYFPNHAKADLDDRKRYWIYPEAGAGEVWQQAAAAVRLTARLPVRPLFVAGYSCGGSAAQLFSSCAPDRVEAAVYISGRTFDLDHPFRGPVLIMRSDQDREMQNISLEKAIGIVPIPPMHFTYPPDWASCGTSSYWAHNVDPSAWTLAEQWLSAIANLRTKNNGEHPPPAQWIPSNGKLWPDPALPALGAAMPASPTVNQDPTSGAQVVTVRPSGDKQVKGTVFWLEHRFLPNDEELTALSQMTASRGFVGVASGGGVDGGCLSLGKCIALCQGSVGRYPAPRTLVLIGFGSEDVEAIAEIAGQVNRTMLIAPVKRSAQSMVNSLISSGQRLEVLCNQETATMLAPFARQYHGLNVHEEPSEGLKSMGTRLSFWTASVLSASTQ